MTQYDIIREALESLRRKHLDVEDSYYSCAAHPDYMGPIDDGQCDCGADTYNAKIDAVLATLTAMEEQEPVAWYIERVAPGKRDNGLRFGLCFKKKELEHFCDSIHFLRPLYAHPSPSPAPVELSAEDVYRLAREVFPPNTTNDGDPWYTDRQSTLNIGAKEALRHITKHYALYPKQPWNATN